MVDWGNVAVNVVFVFINITIWELFLRKLFVSKNDEVQKDGE
jgi:hypothetical protein